MTEPSDNPLAFVDTDALVAEILNRHDSGIVVLYTDQDENRYKTLFYNRGSLPETIGLAKLAEAKMMDMYNGNLVETDEDDNE
jgi:hypothetical protein